MPDTSSVDPKFGSADLAAQNVTTQIPNSGIGGTLDDPFWRVSDIVGTRWNKVFPYQLLIIKKNGSEYDARDDQKFTLPIPPTDLTISTPFAITTVPTLGGIVEEHNAAPLRTITIRGTTGVNPLKNSAPQSQRLSIPDAIFAGTLNAARAAASQGLTAIKGPTTTPNVIPDGDFAGAPGQITGYYQFQLLRKFFEAYITLKKSAAGRDFRLAFAIWKDPAVYLVTPVVFDVIRNGTSPFEYTYNIQFRAWKRIRIGGSQTTPFPRNPTVRDPNALAQALNRLEAARRAVQKSKDAIRAVRADVDASLFQPLRGVVLFIKDVLGVPITIADLPANIARDMKEPILEAVGLDTFPAAIGKSFTDIGPNVRREFATLLQQIRDLSVITGKAQTGTAQQVNAQQDISGASAPNKVFNNPDDSFGFFSLIQVGLLNIPPTTTRAISTERARVQKFTRKDFENQRDGFQSVLDDFTDFVGAGHPTYTKTFNRPTVITTRTPTSDDFDVIFNLNQIILETNRLAASGTVDDRNFLSALDFIAGLATKSGIAFKVPTSKFSVPMPYQYTLEQLSARYLGTPDRWHEIAALNGLRAPYIDEIGFDLALIANGNGSQVVVSVATNLFVGQGVYISSTATPRERRRITGIEKVNDSYFVVSLDGTPNLDRYTVLASAVIHAFLPDTVNSQMQVFIPSDEQPSENDFKAKSIPGVDELDDLVRIGGIDLLLTPLGDLVITPDGDTRLAVGMTNIIQQARLAIATPRGSLLHHPEFGIGIIIGTSIADLSAQDLFDSTKKLFANNPTFTGVQSASVLLNGPVARIALTVGIAGTNRNLPLTFDINRF